ncbi:hypothetical protein LCGC14_2804940 [marine sediment metagenome]|uniref:Uncharacterized protein n=1 Tax=marine sediment metagenome TaxID=412755 RepID=A0A0F9AUY0_9ZZZZ
MVILPPQSEMCVSVECSANGITGRHPDGSSVSIEWGSLTSVTIRTTDQGPVSDDVIWVLEGEEVSCVIPQGIPGEGELLAHLQQLPKFNNDEVTAAMCCCENAEFVCWRSEHSL